MIRLSDINRRRLQRFKGIRRGYWSFWLIVAMIGLCLVAEIFINNRALFVSYQGNYYFPTYGAMIPGSEFGLDYDYETNYRDLKKEIGDKGTVILPLIPYSPVESDDGLDSYPPTPPDGAHPLGTDSIGRDVAARLVYGFRIAIGFSLVLLVFTYLIGVGIGCLMGYYGGAFDLIMQRLIEIWTNIPGLYVIMIVSSIVVPQFIDLVFIMVFFGWTSMTWYMRTIVYKEKAREYALASDALGASTTRTVFKHILPNSLSVIITFIPFSVSSGIVALTSLDYLGFGLPRTTPSWGELLKIGMENLEATWILGSVVVAMSIVLTMITFVGEAIREAFDPKTFSFYR